MLHLRYCMGRPLGPVCTRELVSWACTYLESADTIGPLHGFHLQACKKPVHKVISETLVNKHSYLARNGQPVTT